MSLNLNDLLAQANQEKLNKAMRIVLYGTHKIGKTTFADQWPNCVFIRTEDGTTRTRSPALPLCNNYGDLIGQLDTLITQEHDFKTVCLDSLDWAEPLVWVATAQGHGKESIEDFDYGKGYNFALDYWKAVIDRLNALRTRGITVICLAHYEVKRFDSPDQEPYDRYQIKLHKNASSKFQEWADCIFFANYKSYVAKSDVGFGNKVSRAIGQGERVLYTEERPAFLAGNRYGLPPEINFSYADFDAALRATEIPVN